MSWIKVGKNFINLDAVQSVLDVRDAPLEAGVSWPCVRVYWREPQSEATAVLNFDGADADELVARLDAISAAATPADTGDRTG